MKQLKQVIEKITPLDNAVMDKVQTRLDSLTKPRGSLGTLEIVAKQAAGAMRNTRPTLKRKALVLMAADHGVAIEKVSAYPQEVTKQMIYNFVNGGAAINVLAKHANAELTLVDIGVNAELSPDLPIYHNKIRFGTANIRRGPAMSKAEVLQAITVGVDIANALLDGGVKIIGLGEMGIGNSTISSAVTSVLACRPPAEVTGCGTGLTDELIAHKIKVIEDSIAINCPNADDVIDVLAKIGGLELAGLTGVILAGTARRALIVLDGFISSTAALAAYHLSPAIKPYLIASHLSSEPGHTVIMKKLGLEPLLKLKMRLGEGTGAALGMTILDAGLKILNEMATFDEAKVASVLADFKSCRK